MIENIKDNPLIEKRIEISNNYTSCIYCGIRTEEVLIQCGQCDHKFCNGISEDINNSHILTHFDISKHNTIKINFYTGFSQYGCSILTSLPIGVGAT